MNRGILVLGWLGVVGLCGACGSEPVQPVWIPVSQSPESVSEDQMGLVGRLVEFGSDRPVVGARVESFAPTEVVQTREDGAYVLLDDVVGGVLYTVYASADGYEDAQAKVWSRDGMLARGDIRMVLSQDALGVDVEPAAVFLGADRNRALVRMKNTSKEAVAWCIPQGQNWLGVEPARGELGVGEEIRLRVGVRAGAFAGGVESRRGWFEVQGLATGEECGEGGLRRVVDVLALGGAGVEIRGDVRLADGGVCRVEDGGVCKVQRGEKVRVRLRVESGGRGSGVVGSLVGIRGGDGVVVESRTDEDGWVDAVLDLSASGERWDVEANAAAFCAGWEDTSAGCPRVGFALEVEDPGLDSTDGLRVEWREVEEGRGRVSSREGGGVASRVEFRVVDAEGRAVPGWDLRVRGEQRSEGVYVVADAAQWVWVEGVDSGADGWTRVEWFSEDVFGLDRLRGVEVEAVYAQNDALVLRDEMGEAWMYPRLAPFTSVYLEESGVDRGVDRTVLVTQEGQYTLRVCLQYAPPQSAGEAVNVAGRDVRMAVESGDSGVFVSEFVQATDEDGCVKYAFDVDRQDAEVVVAFSTDWAGMRPSDATEMLRTVRVVPQMDAPQVTAVEASVESVLGGTQALVSGPELNERGFALRMQLDGQEGAFEELVERNVMVRRSDGGSWDGLIAWDGVDNPSGSVRVFVEGGVALLRGRFVGQPDVDAAVPIEVILEESPSVRTQGTLRFQVAHLGYRVETRMRLEGEQRECGQVSVEGRVVSMDPYDALLGTALVVQRFERAGSAVGEARTVEVEVVSQEAVSEDDQAGFVALGAPQPVSGLGVGLVASVVEALGETDTASLDVEEVPVADRVRVEVFDEDAQVVERVQPGDRFYVKAFAVDSVGCPVEGVSWELPADGCETNIEESDPWVAECMFTTFGQRMFAASVSNDERGEASVSVEFLGKLDENYEVLVEWQTVADGRGRVAVGGDAGVPAHVEFQVVDSFGNRLDGWDLQTRGEVRTESEEQRIYAIPSAEGWVSLGESSDGWTAISWFSQDVCSLDIVDGVEVRLVYTDPQGRLETLFIPADMDKAWMYPRLAPSSIVRLQNSEINDQEDAVIEAQGRYDIQVCLQYETRDPEPALIPVPDEEVVLTIGSGDPSIFVSELIQTTDASGCVVYTFDVGFETTDVEVTFLVEWEGMREEDRTEVIRTLRLMPQIEALRVTAGETLAFPNNTSQGQELSVRLNPSREGFENDRVELSVVEYSDGVCEPEARVHERSVALSVDAEGEFQGPLSREDQEVLWDGVPFGTYCLCASRVATDGGAAESMECDVVEVVPDPGQSAMHMDQTLFEWNEGFGNFCVFGQINGSFVSGEDTSLYVSTRSCGRFIPDTYASTTDPFPAENVGQSQQKSFSACFAVGDFERNGESIDRLEPGVYSVYPSTAGRGTDTCLEVVVLGVQFFEDDGGQIQMLESEDDWRHMEFVGVAQAEPGDGLGFAVVPFDAELGACGVDILVEGDGVIEDVDENDILFGEGPLAFSLREIDPHRHYINEEPPDDGSTQYCVCATAYPGGDPNALPRVLSDACGVVDYDRGD